MKRLSLLLFGLLLACAAGVSHAQRADVPRLWELSGTVLGFDEDSFVLDVNTRLGRKQFLTTNTTLYLLNNHAADFQDILPGDAVTVTYRFDTSEARIVHLFREARADVRVLSVGNNVINVELDGATIPLRTDAGTVLRLGGVPINNTSVLIGRRVSAIFEPGTQLLLSLSARAPTLNAKVRTVDVTGRRISLTGRERIILGLDDAAVIRRGNAFVGLDALRKGDRLTLVLNERSPSARVLAVHARPVRRR